MFFASGEFNHAPLRLFLFLAGMAFGLLRSAYIYYETIIGLLSLAMNSLIIYLVLMRTSPSLKQYSFIILLGAFVDLIFCTVNLITVEVNCKF